MGKADRFGKANVEKNLTQGPLKKWDTCEWKKPNQSVKMLTEEDTKAIFIQWSLKYKQSYYLHAYTIWGNRCMAPSSFVCPPSSTFSMLSTTASGGAPTGVINQIPALNKLALNLRNPSVTVLPLEWPPSPQWHGCWFFFSLQRPPINLIIAVLVIPMALSAIHIHGLTNKPPTSHYYYKKPRLLSILLTAVDEILFFQAFALKHILNSDFSWHCQFQEMPPTDEFVGPLVCDCYFWREIHYLSLVCPHRPTCCCSKQTSSSVFSRLLSRRWHILGAYTRFFPSFMTFPPRSQSTLLELYHVSKCTIHLSKPLYTWIWYTYILNWLVYHRIRASDHLSDPMLQDY